MNHFRVVGIVASVVLVAAVLVGAIGCEGSMRGGGMHCGMMGHGSTTGTGAMGGHTAIEHQTMMASHAVGMSGAEAVRPCSPASDGGRAKEERSGGDAGRAAECR